MTGHPGYATDRLAELRQSFDAGFTIPARLHDESLEPLLVIRVAGERLAVKTRHIGGLARAGRILPVPSRVPELLGITAIRGVLMPVCDLAALLGFPSSRAQFRWLALTGGETPVALAFDQVEGLVAVGRADLYEHQASEGREHLKELARIESQVCAIADFPAVVETIQRRAGPINPDKE